MNEAIWTEAEALERARELVRLFEQNPDVLSPDEQALVMMIRMTRQALDHLIAELLRAVSSSDSPSVPVR